MKNFLKNLGPGILVSAAFIGPGTVTICSIAGVYFGYSLLWALLISIFACIVLQEMSARLGLISGKGLSDCIRDEMKNPVIRIFILFLIFSAIVIGNAAYEAGNITGAVLGAEAVFSSVNFEIGAFSINIWSLIIGGVAFSLLYLGSYKKLEKVFIALVLLMSIAFILTAFLTKPDLSEVLKGFVPGSFDSGLLTIIALVGTTVVPYNLFLHASLVSEKWSGPKYLGAVRKELVFSLLLGGLVSMAIVVCAAASNINDIESAADLAVGLEPLFGSSATIFLAVGLLAAGITSSITAPLAAAYVVQGCLGWKGGMQSPKFKMVWMIIIILGVLFSSLGVKPVEIIQFAQIANGLVLPVIAIFLFWIVNQRSVLGKYRNNFLQNLIGGVVITLAIFLGVKSIFNVIQNL
ncbi:Nramp family divalent metal transporter [Christiangramia echinicola]|uniref:NRAMP (Natural resistance-associated macrophage protein) metal ion transporters n=1 Tax=Christiangramia echinicola TaxID=279359 RepID=A0A1H1QEP8_9FLAO|nr:Nramp family divalent metal transporter [Christiangramia echinicola]SDS21906.1 NRAMP (natural resistance-associated macrophage protein) metal ion transporters [Christiangramia echinicola]